MPVCQKHAGCYLQSCNWPRCWFALSWGISEVKGCDGCLCELHKWPHSSHKTENIAGEDGWSAVSAGC